MNSSVDFTCLVVGAHGWVGRSLTSRFDQHGIKWIGVNRGETARLLAQSDDGFPNFATLRQEFPVVVNLAGRQSSGPESEGYIALTRKLATLANQNQWRYIHIGSAAEFGSPTTRFIDDQDQTSPLSAYGRMKAEASEIALANGALVLRPFNLVGPGQPMHTLVGDWLRQLMQVSHGRPSVHVGNPKFVRDFVSVGFLSQVICKLALSSATGPVNVCSGIATDYESFLHELIRASGKNCQIERGDDDGIPRVVGSPNRLSALGISSDESVRDLATQLYEH